MTSCLRWSSTLTITTLRLVADCAGDFELEGREAAFVLAELGAVQEDDGAIVGGAEPEKDAVAGSDGAIEIAFVPDGAFVPA